MCTQRAPASPTRRRDTGLLTTRPLIPAASLLGRFHLVFRLPPPLLALPPPLLSSPPPPLLSSPPPPLPLPSRIRDAHDLAGGADAAAGGVPAPGEPGGVAP